MTTRRGGEAAEQHFQSERSERQRIEDMRTGGQYRGRYCVFEGLRRHSTVPCLTHPSPVSLIIYALRLRFGLLRQLRCLRG